MSNPTDPRAIHALMQQGLALHRGQQFDAAAALYRRVLQDSPAHFDALHLLGLLLTQRGEYAAALPLLRQAVALNPASAGALTHLGAALIALKEPADAAAQLTAALHINAQSPAGWNNLGNAQHALGQHEAAIHSYDAALSLQPGNADAWCNRANALFALNRWDEALASFDRACAISPEHRSAATMRIHLKSVARWAGLHAACEAQWRAIDSNQYQEAPLQLLCMPGVDGARVLRATQSHIAHGYGTPGPEALALEPPAGDRIHVAYVSADFCQHALSFLMAGLFARHDRERFRITGVSIGRRTDSMTERLRAGFDEWVDAAGLTDAELVDAMRARRVDIAVDLMGHTRHNRFAAFHARLAPVQVNYLGYPATAGSPSIDYVIGDRWVFGGTGAAEFCEQRVVMPDSFQVNDAERAIAPETPTRESLGLPPAGFVFCCLNKTYKITPDVFDLWMRLLTDVPGSVLWLLGDTPSGVQHLREEASARGIDPGRLVFSRRAPYAKYLAQYRAADLFLDTLPFNAGTTASDALWAGLPVLTQAGPTFAGRMAASLLAAVGLPELISQSSVEYEQRARQLARDPALLGAYRARLIRHRTSAPLFDTARTARHLEAAYAHMVARQRQGLPPTGFEVPALPNDRWPPHQTESP